MEKAEQAKFKISQKQFFPIIEEMLKAGKNVRFTVFGNSMWPWIISDRDSVLLTRCDNAHLKKGNIILFHTASGNYVLHRITKVKRDGYITTGDGNLWRDGFVPQGKVIARVESIYRKDIVIECSGWKWKAISSLWMASFPIRRILQLIVLK